MDRAIAGKLMDQVAAGNADAFVALAEAVQSTLYRFSIAQGLNSTDATDAVQETLTRAFASRKKWVAGSDGLAWMYGIAMNVIRESRRRNRRGPNGLQELVLQELSDGKPDVSTALAASEAERECLRQLAEAVEALPPRQREAVACRYLRRLSIHDTAAALGCAEGTVKSTLAAALEKLRRIMGARS